MTTGLDEAIEPVREARRRISEACGHDLAKYMEYLRFLNERFADEVVNCGQVRDVPRRGGAERG